MKRYLLTAALLIGSYLHVFSQSPDQLKDNRKIDSLTKLLPSLKGTDRVDCMVLICEYFSDIASLPGGKTIDSIRYYGNIILNESKNISYKKGIAMGLLFSSPDSLKEKKTKEAIRIGEEAGNDEVLGWGYSLLISYTKDPGEVNEYYKKAILHFQKAGKIVRAAAMSNWLCQSYMGTGENEKALDNAKESLESLKAIPSAEFAIAYSWALLWALWNMSGLYSAAGDYESALNYMQLANEVDRTSHANTTWGGFTLDISSIYTQLGKYDSAMVFWNRYINEPAWINSSIWKPGKILAYNYLGTIQIKNKEYDKAIDLLTSNNIYFDSLLNYGTGNFKNAGNFGKMAASLSLSEAYDGQKNYTKALQYAKEGLFQAMEKNRRPEMMQGYQLLSTAYHHLKNNDSAYEYLLKYNLIKDAIQNKQFLLRIYNSKIDAENAKKESRIGLLNKDNKIKEQQLKQEATFRNFLMAVFIAVIFAGLYLIRNIYLKRKNERLQQEHKEQQWRLKELQSENKHVELQRQSVELEIQALRAQMNPHFIFNCLSSINRFIYKNDNKVASDYLTRFSRLIRMVLMHSQKKLITLEEELEMLRLYLDLERLRFKDAFDYSITTTNIVDAGAIFIPPLLLQPFCENAVWHGLMHKESKGHLNLIISEVISVKEKVLHCVIEDDGVGRENAAEMKSKSAENEKSMGLKITTARLALLNGENNFNTFYQIEDVLNENNEVAGTRVQLKIRYKESVEEYA